MPKVAIQWCTDGAVWRQWAMRVHDSSGPIKKCQKLKNFWLSVLKCFKTQWSLKKNLYSCVQLVNFKIKIKNRILQNNGYQSSLVPWNLWVLYFFNLT